MSPDTVGVSCAGAGQGQGGGPGRQEAGQAAGPGVAQQRDDCASKNVIVDIQLLQYKDNDRLCSALGELVTVPCCYLHCATLGGASSGCVPSDVPILPDAGTVRQMTKLLRMRIKNVCCGVQGQSTPVCWLPSPAAVCGTMNFV